MNKKTGLVISGGGSKGAFAIGVLKYLMRKKSPMQFDIIGGTSTGSMIAPLVVLDQIEELEKTYTSVTTKDILQQRCIVKIPFSNSIFKTTPLEKLIASIITPEKAQNILKSNKQMFITTTDLQTGRVSLFHSGPKANKSGRKSLFPLKSRDDIMKAMLASSNQPVIMPPIEIKTGKKMHQHVDGGVRDVAPFKAAISNGATDIVAIVLDEEKISASDSKYKYIPDIATRTLMMLIKEITDNDVDYAEFINQGINYINNTKKKIMKETGLSETKVDKLFQSVKNPFKGKRLVNLKVIRPKVKLPGGDLGLQFNKKEMKEMVDIGFRQAKKEFGP